MQSDIERILKERISRRFGAVNRERRYYPVVVAVLLGLLLAALVPTVAMASDSYSVAVDEHEDENGDDESDLEDSPFCVVVEGEYELTHPVAEGITETYSDTVEGDYAIVMDWFCNGFGFGQILLALQTETILEGPDAPTADDLLTRRVDGEGWGQIWQDLELIGRPEDAGPPFGDPPGRSGDVPPGPPDGEPPTDGDEPGPPFGDPPGRSGDVPPGPPDGDPPDEGDEPGPPGGEPPGKSGDVPPGPPDGEPPDEGESPGPPGGEPPGRSGDVPPGPPDGAPGRGHGPP